jgi:hypothetical protein
MSIDFTKLGEHVWMQPQVDAIAFSGVRQHTWMEPQTDALAFSKMSQHTWMQPQINTAVLTGLRMHTWMQAATSVDVLGSIFNTTSGEKTITATPSVDDLIIIIGCHSGNGYAAPTDDQGGTYTEAVRAAREVSGKEQGIWIRNSLVSSAVSTIYSQGAGTTGGGGMVILRITGMTRTGANAMRQVAESNNITSALIPTTSFASAVLHESIVIGAVNNNLNPATLTPPPLYAEAADLGFNIPTTGLEVVWRNTGETGTTITWGNASTTHTSIVLLELDTSPAPGGRRRMSLM